MAVDANPPTIGADALELLDHDGLVDAVEELNNNANEDNSDNEDDEQLGPMGPKAYRSEQANIFKEFVRENAAKVADAQEKKNRIKSNLDDGRSTAELLTESAAAQAKLHDPREYQLELFERAKKDNTIAVLDTGSGKTLIAVLLLRHVLDQELEDRAKGLDHRVAFFMVCFVSQLFTRPELVLLTVQGPLQHTRLSTDCCAQLQFKSENRIEVWRYACE